MATSGAEWALVGVGAGAATATAIAAGFTAWMASKTKTLAESGNKQAKAALDLVAEAQLDRELSYRPVLAVRSKRESVGSDWIISLRNIGTGPALGCIYAVQEGGLWNTTERADLAPGDRVEARALPRGAGPNFAWWAKAPVQSGPPAEVVFCRDVFNKRYRFLIDDAGHVLTAEVKSREYRSTTTGGDWWTDYALWGTT